MSTTLRIYWLRMLQHAGVKQFRAVSGLGHPFICFVGDFLGENPFYNRDQGRTEILLMSAWSRRCPARPVFDVGGNVGFYATQLAQLTADTGTQIFAFEPSPLTFQRLVRSVELLGLSQRVAPICCAVADQCGAARIAFEASDTMRGHIVSRPESANKREQIAWAGCLTLDALIGSVGSMPSFVKVDVEGYEVSVLRGARTLLTAPDAPALMLEWNPGALARAGFSTADLAHELEGLCCFYVNDFTGQRLPIGRELGSLIEIDWECNILAVPNNETSLRTWDESREQVERELASLRSGDG